MPQNRCRSTPRARPDGRVLGDLADEHSRAPSFEAPPGEPGPLCRQSRQGLAEPGGRRSSCSERGLTPPAAVNPAEATAQLLRHPWNDMSRGGLYIMPLSRRRRASFGNLRIQLPFPILFLRPPSGSCHPATGLKPVLRFSPGPVYPSGPFILVARTIRGQITMDFLFILWMTRDKPRANALCSLSRVLAFLPGQVHRLRLSAPHVNGKNCAVASLPIYKIHALAPPPATSEFCESRGRGALRLGTSSFLSSGHNKSACGPKRGVQK